MLTLSKTMVSEQDVESVAEPWYARVLVVDDDCLMVDLVRTMLEKLNFRMDTANDGREAMRHLQSTAYDLVVTDLQMPFINGFELAGWIKENLTDTPVVIMTGCADPDPYIDEHASPVDRWLFKPVDYGKLHEVLSDFFPIGAQRGDQ